MLPHLLTQAVLQVKLKLHPGICCSFSAKSAEVNWVSSFVLVIHYSSRRVKFHPEGLREGEQTWKRGKMSYASHGNHPWNHILETTIYNLKPPNTCRDASPPISSTIQTLDAIDHFEPKPAKHTWRTQLSNNDKSCAIDSLVPKRQTRNEK